MKCHSYLLYRKANALFQLGQYRQAMEVCWTGDQLQEANHDMRRDLLPLMDEICSKSLREGFARPGVDNAIYDLIFSF